MRRSALALFVAAAIALPAYAEGPQTQSSLALVAPTPAVSDNGDRIATTAWVNNFFALGIPLANGKIFIGSSGGIAAQQTLSGDCSLIASGVITCTQAAGNFNVIGNLTVGGSIIDGNGILFTNIVAPATPAAGTTRAYVDSTTKTLSAKNDVGTVSNTVVPSVAVANQFMTGIGAAGVITRAQPAFSDLSGQGTCAQEPALTGDVTTSSGSCATILATVNTNTGPWGTATQSPQITVNGKGLVTAAANVTITPAIGSITGLGTGVATALGAAANASGGFPTINNSAVLMGAPAAPASFTATSPGVMMGLGVSTCRFTPVSATRVNFYIYGQIANNTAGNADNITMKFSTGAGPANGVAATGTTLGTPVTYTSGTASSNLGFWVGGIATGLTAGTTYWFDLAAYVNAGTGTVSSITCAAHEVL